MKKIILLLTIIFTLAVSAVYSADTNSYYQLGRQAYSSGDYKLAQRYFWAILNQSPSNLQARYYLAHSLAKQQRYDDAYVEYQRIIQASPNSETAKYAKQSISKISPFLSRQAQNISQQASTDNKPDYFLNALSTKNQVMRWAKMPVIVYVQNSQYKDVVKSAFMVWQNGTKGIVSFLYTDYPQNAQIEVTFKNKLENTNTQKGYISGTTKPYFKGINMIKAEMTLLTINPNTQQPLTKEQVYATALHEVGHAIGIKGHSQNQGDVMYASGAGHKKTLSIRDYNTVKLLYKVNPNALQPYTQEIQKTKLNEAIAYVNKYPTKAIGWLNLADIYRNNNDIPKAIEMYNKALNLDNSQNEAYFFLGECHLKKGDTLIALNYYQQALNKAPDNKFYLQTFANVCKQTGTKDIAQRYLNDYLKRHPNQVNDSMIQSIQNTLR